MEKPDQFFSRFRQRTYKKGEIIISSTEKYLINVYYLKKGYVRQYVLGKNKKELTLNLFKPGAFFPLILTLNNLENRFTFEALTDVVIHIAPKKQVELFLKKNPDILMDVAKRFGKGLNGLLTTIKYLMSGEAKERILMALFIHAKRFGRPLDKEIEIHLPLTQKELANQLGLSRETVNREMQRLMSSGLVKKVKGKLMIRNLANIEKKLS